MKPIAFVPLTPAALNASPMVLASEPESIDIRHVVFQAPQVNQPAAGGGGGGNRQHGPIRRAQGIGEDSITLRVTQVQPPPEIPAMSEEEAPLATTEITRWAPIVLDAASLASGTFEQSGLPGRGPIHGTSIGPGTGGGVGTGHGTGIGSGSGPGIGPGAGGGTGGGAYRPGGSVTTPRVIVEVKPVYTDDALQRKVQGTVLLELVVTRDGLPSNIRVVRSLDPGGLDQAAVHAAERWRFEPGRLAGAPVDVLVTLMIDFWIW